MDLKEDLEEKANREDMTIISAENDEIRKKVGRFVTSQEVTARFDGLSQDLSRKLADRPTLGYLN